MIFVFRLMLFDFINCIMFMVVIILEIDMRVKIVFFLILCDAVILVNLYFFVYISLFVVIIFVVRLGILFLVIIILMKGSSLVDI